MAMLAGAGVGVGAVVGSVFMNGSGSTTHCSGGGGVTLRLCSPAVCNETENDISEIGNTTKTGRLSEREDQRRDGCWQSSGDESLCSSGKKRNIQVEELAEALQGLSLDNDKWTKLTEMVRSNDIQLRYNGVKGFRVLLGVMGDIPIQDVVNTGIIPRLVEILGANNDSDPAVDTSLEFEAAWVLTNVASGTPEQTEAVVRAGGVERLLQLLQSTNDEVREQGMWGLGNIAGDRVEYRDAILNDENAVRDVIQACQSSRRLDGVRTGVWCISNFCRGKPRPPYKLVKSILPYLRGCIIHSTDVNVLSDACWALDGIGETISGITGILQCGLAERLISLLGHEHAMVQRPAIRVLGQIATGTAKQTQAIINVGLIPALVDLLRSPAQPLRKDACWTMSNIAAGTADQLQMLIDRNAFSQLVELYRSDEDLGVRMEAAWAVVNACTTQIFSQLEHLIACNCLTPVCETLLSEDSRILLVVLTSLENMLSFGAAKSIELNVESNPVAQAVVSLGGFDNLLQLHAAAEQSGSFELWDRSGALLRAHFTNGLST